MNREANSFYLKHNIWVS